MKSSSQLRGWLRTTATLVVAALAVVLVPSRAAAQANANPPERMSYQGFLVDGNGTALGNTAPKNYDIIFKIFNHETQSAAANLLWAEQQTVTVDKGYFSVMLGEGAAAEGKPANQKLSDAFKGSTASDRFIGVTVIGIGNNNANVDILPRLRLITSPYSYLSLQANKLVRTDTGTDLLTSSGNAVSIGGTLAATSFSGNGAALTSLNAGNLASGSIPDARLSANVALRSGGNTFSGAQVFNDSVGIGTASPLTRLQVGSFGVADNYVTIATAGGNLYKSGVRLRHFNNNWGWTVESDETVNKLKFIAHSDNAAGTTRFELGYGGRADLYGGLGVSGANVIEFGSGNSKQVDAGKIGYGTFDPSALCIVGAGTSGTNRKIKMWAEGGAIVSTSFGDTFRVASDFAEILNFSDKSKVAWLYRSGVAFGVAVVGGNAHTTTRRDATYDGDSNWDFSSDRRLKKDIVDAEDVLDRALAVRLRRFHWNEDSETNKLHMGVIAQELQPLFPDMVGSRLDPESNEERLTVGYSDFGMIAIKAIQELKQRNDAEKAAMQAEIDGLKAEMGRLRSEMAEVVEASRELRQVINRSKATAAVAR